MGTKYYIENIRFYDMSHIIKLLHYLYHSICITYLIKKKKMVLEVQSDYI